MLKVEIKKSQVEDDPSTVWLDVYAASRYIGAVIAPVEWSQAEEEAAVRSVFETELPTMRG